MISRILWTLEATGVFSFLCMLVYDELVHYREVPKAWRWTTYTLLLIPLLAIEYGTIWGI